MSSAGSPSGELELLAQTLDHFSSALQLVVERLPLLREPRDLLLRLGGGHRGQHRTLLVELGARRPPVAAGEHARLEPELARLLDSEYRAAMRGQGQQQAAAVELGLYDWPLRVRRRFEAAG